MALIDPVTNRPFPPAMLRRVAGGPTLVGSRPAIHTTPIGNIDPRMLGSLLTDAAQGNSLSWQTFCEEIESRDLHYLSVLSTRKRTVAQVPITVTDAGPSRKQKKQAQFVRDWVERGVLRHAIFDMLDAIAKGWSVHAIEWGLKTGGYVPDKLLFRPQRWFDISYQDGESLKIRDDASVTFTPDMIGALPESGFAGVDPRQYVVHRHPSWSGLTLQSGLTRAIAWASMFKFFTVRDWGIFVQNFGLPGRIGRYGPGASEEDREVLWRAVTDYGGMFGAIMPKDMDFELVEPKHGAGSNDIHERRAKWLDEQISKAVLGQTGTTDARSGTHASGAIHRQVQEDIERADGLLLSWTVNEQIVRPMIDMTFGGADGDYPLVMIGRPDEIPLSELVQAVQWLGPQGLKVKAQEVLDRMSLSPPEDGDETIGIAAQPQPVQPSHDLPGEQRTPQSLPARASAPTVQSEPAQGQELREQKSGGKLALHAQIGQLLEKHVQAEGPHVIDLMTQRLARTAASAVNGMTGAVREQLTLATSMEDLRDRLERLNLDDDAFGVAMQAGVLVAELAGEASALDAMKRG
ncbi:DUF935 domain-containing protein [Acetobacter fallax]|uniref:DUF935 family protein n=1 Tax=Acetobacter fallax TaxID=1737473 RepID=A0ABX0KA92_9PROT|nr:DUF935 family protein [Acetobacter fallax]NHO33319.1 DUF935 family protein [Acetobacter fallax]NHO36940.1 DUF935 family protein [Acetobacter fallax]